ncbi:alanine racemase [Rothia sp. LK2588]|uniref:alanine racemase n=1 Tax=Rothia sp. LK2588 TaxID=3114369 RepID=UPI0034CFC7DF
MTVHHHYEPVRAPGAPERMAVIDLDAVAHNVRHIRTLIGDRTFIAVVKADAYGHGMEEVARTVLGSGADMLGVVHVSEALRLRRAGIDAPILAWLHTPNTDFEAALNKSIQLGVSGWDLEAVAEAARATGWQARVHLKIDTGLGRNGSTLEKWPELVQRAAEYEEEGVLHVEGIFSHLAVADEPERAENAEQSDAFARAVGTARAAGLAPKLVHIANTPGTLVAVDNDDPRSVVGNGVRVGLGIYGLSPFEGKTSEDLGLIPAMTVQTFISAVKEVPAGQGVSYGLHYVTEKPTTLAVVPVGYADGVPRVATGGPVRVYPTGSAEPKTYWAVGRIAMDQLVIDLGEPGLADPALGYLGASAVLFGAGEDPRVEEWAEKAGTINYEVVTRISDRIERVYTGGEQNL